MIHLDFESRSEVDIWECGAWVYSMHPSTEVLCMAFSFDESHPCLVTREQLNDGICPDLQEFIDRISQGELVTAHNAFFEQCIWHNHMHKKFNLPEIPLQQWRCSAAKASAHALPKALKNVGAALHLATLKSEEGRAIMLKMCRPRRPSKNNPANWFEDPEDFDKLYDYCINDVEAEKAVDDYLDNLNPFEQKVWFLDQKMNFRGVKVDLEAIDAAIGFIQEYSQEQIQIVEKLSRGFLDGVSRRNRVMQWVESQGVSMPGYTKEDILNVLNRPNVPDHVRQVLEIRQQLGKTSVKKYDSMRRAAGHDGRIRDTLVYHGAATGRWAGKLIQLQNLPRGSVENTDTCIQILKQNNLETFKMLYPDVMGSISSCIRGMIVAPEGSKLYVADYNAIEARVLLWLADDQSGLTKFRKGEDLYVDLSKVIFNKEKITRAERQLGKTAILGCGYGMGPAKFQATCSSWGIEIEPALAERVVKAYRLTYATVQKMWWDQERASIHAVQSGQEVTCGKVSWVYEPRKDFLFCKLPSGRRLAYREPKVKPIKTPWGEMKDALHFMGVNSQTNQWVEQNTYGGKLTENITQAVARDILAEAMIRAETWYYPVIFSVHDEIVCEVPDEKNYKTKGQCYEEFIKCLTIKPKWALGCPITAEGWVGTRYRK